MSFLFGLLILVLVLGLVVGLMVYGIRQMTIIPEPFKGTAIGVVCLIACIFLIAALMGQVPMPNLFPAGKHG